VTGSEFTGFSVTDEVGTKRFMEMDTYAGRLNMTSGPEFLFPYLEQNFPNPASHLTSIVYGIPETGHVSITLFDLSGKQILSMIDKKQMTGRYRIEFPTIGLRPGVYYYRLEFTGDRHTSQLTRKMICTQ